MRSRGVVLPLLALALVFSGCGGTDDGGKPAKGVVGAPTPGATAQPTAAPTGPLSLGQHAKLTWQASQNRSGVVAVAVNQVIQGTAKALSLVHVNPPLDDPHLYFVKVRVINASRVDFGGASPLNLPLYIVDQSDLMQPPVRFDHFEYSYCPTDPLPVPWADKAATDVCLVYVSRGAMKQLVLSGDGGRQIVWNPVITVPPTPKAPARRHRAPKTG